MPPRRSESTRLRTRTTSPPCTFPGPRNGRATSCFRRQPTGSCAYRMRTRRTRTRPRCTSAIWEVASRRRAGCRAAAEWARGPQPIWRRSACGRTRYALGGKEKKKKHRRSVPFILTSTKAFLSDGRVPHFWQLDLKNDLDIRAPSLHTGARTWVTDYLVGCHASEESGLSVLVGSNEHVLFSVVSIFFPRSSCFRPKGRRRAAQERGLSRSRIAVVFRAVVDGPSQGRRASGSPRRTSKPYLPLFIRFEYVRTLVIV